MSVTIYRLCVDGDMDSKLDIINYIFKQHAVSE